MPVGRLNKATAETKVIIDWAQKYHRQLRRGAGAAITIQCTCRGKDGAECGAKVKLAAGWPHCTIFIEHLEQQHKLERPVDSDRFMDSVTPTICRLVSFLMCTFTTPTMTDDGEWSGMDVALALRFGALLHTPTPKDRVQHFMVLAFRPDHHRYKLPKCIPTFLEMLAHDDLSFQRCGSYFLKEALTIDPRPHTNQEVDQMLEVYVRLLFTIGQARINAEIQNNCLEGLSVLLPRVHRHLLDLEHHWDILGRPSSGGASAKLGAAWEVQDAKSAEATKRRDQQLRIEELNALYTKLLCNPTLGPTTDLCDIVLNLVVEPDRGQENLPDLPILFKTLVDGMDRHSQGYAAHMLSLGAVPKISRVLIHLIDYVQSVSESASSHRQDIEAVAGRLDLTFACLASLLKTSSWLANPPREHQRIVQAATWKALRLLGSFRGANVRVFPRFRSVQPQQRRGPAESDSSWESNVETMCMQTLGQLCSRMTVLPQRGQQSYRRKRNAIRTEWLPLLVESSQIEILLDCYSRTCCSSENQYLYPRGNPTQLSIELMLKQALEEWIGDDDDDDDDDDWSSRFRPERLKQDEPAVPVAGAMTESSSSPCTEEFGILQPLLGSPLPFLYMLAVETRDRSISQFHLVVQIYKANPRLMKGASENQDIAVALLNGARNAYSVGACGDPDEVGAIVWELLKLVPPQIAGVDTGGDESGSCIDVKEWVKCITRLTGKRSFFTLCRCVHELVLRLGAPPALDPSDCTIQAGCLVVMEIANFFDAAESDILHLKDGSHLVKGFEAIKMIDQLRNMLNDFTRLTSLLKEGGV